MILARQHLFIIIISAFFIGCMGKETDDAAKAYRYWAMDDPPGDIELMNGRYWESSHFTKEYIMYLKLKPTTVWWDELLKQNQFIIDNESWTRPDDAPVWFTPTASFIRYKRNDNFDQGTRYFRDTSTGICYMYEIQL